VGAAGVDESARGLGGEANRAEEERKADGEAASVKKGARTHQVTGLATGRGGAIAFQTLQASYGASPEVFALVRYLQSVEGQLAGKKFHVIDHTIEEDGGAIWLLD